MVVYRCEDSLESIFTAVYQAYEEKRRPEETVLSLSNEPMLFAEDIEVAPCVWKVKKVMSTLKSRFGEDNYMEICMALAAENEEKAQAVYQTVADGLSRSSSGLLRRGGLFDNLANLWVHKTFTLARGVSREIRHLKGFLRFEELEKGVLYSKIGPKGNIVTFLMPHFADRFPAENFMIYDDMRNFFGIHPAGNQWYLLRREEINGALELTLSEEERTYQELFRLFCHTIAIKERENTKLQRQMLPLRYQEYMIEFD